MSDFEQRLEQIVARALNNGHYCRSADTLQAHQRMLEKNTDVLSDIGDKVNEINNKVDITRERLDRFQDTIEDKLSNMKEDLKDTSKEIELTDDDVHTLMNFKTTTEMTLVQLVTTLNDIQRILTPENAEFIKNIKSNYTKLNSYKVYFLAIATGLGLLFTVLSNFNNILNIINGWRTFNATNQTQQTINKKP